MVAACDAEILGTTLEEGDLRVVVGEGFYGGEKVEAEVLGRLFELATMINLIGPRVVALAVGLGLVDEGCIMTIDGVPHAMVLRMA